jgi:hypothetical protein
MERANDSVSSFSTTVNPRNNQNREGNL